MAYAREMIRIAYTSIAWAFWLSLAACGGEGSADVDAAFDDGGVDAATRDGGGIPDADSLDAASSVDGGPVPDADATRDGSAADGGQITVPECPGAFASCSELSCSAGEICLEVMVTCGPAGGQTAQCIADPCVGGELDCTGCAGAVCDSIEAPPVGYSCSTGATGSPTARQLRCSGGGVCASPDTLIATPAGEVRIADLRLGDLVYSTDSVGTVVVPLLAATGRRVWDHSVVHLVLDDGTTLDISGPHPIADGRPLDSLAVGDELDGRRVISTDLVDYPHAHTYDILPGSDTGHYVANGILMGSTLRYR